MSSLSTEQQQIILSNPAADISKRLENREGSVERKAAKERDDKLKVARERQNEERQRKIEELKAQAEAAQKYREQKEEERRRRIEEIRHRDSEKRQQVEERKKAIMEAEKERREYILRKNQERESRLELKKRERSSIGYAFGSSTPRLLEPADFGIVSSSTFWGQRRSTSISNVANATTISRRSSERELNDGGIKKRATSSSDNERHDGHRRKSTSMYEVFNWNDEPPKRFSLSIIGSEINIDDPPDIINHKQYNTNVPTNVHHKQYLYHNFCSLTSSPAKEDGVVNPSPIVFRSVARRKTDLMPTIPSPREGQYGSRSSLSTPRTPGSRSGNVTPGGHINNNSRPGSAMSTSTTLSTTGFLNRRSTPMMRKPRPASIAGTGVSLEAFTEMNRLKKETRPPTKPLQTQTTPKRLPNMMSTSLIVPSSTRFLTPEKKTTPLKKVSPMPKPSTPKSFSKSTSSDRLNKINKEKTKENDLKSPVLTNRIANGKTLISSTDNKELIRKSKEEKETINQVKTEQIHSTNTANMVLDQSTVLNNIQNVNGANNAINSIITSQDDEKTDIGSEKENQLINVNSCNNLNQSQQHLSTDNNKIDAVLNVQESNVSEGDNHTDAMTASMIAKSKITTEEEAKAALAERRRLAREEAERQAELERQRVEAERLAEIKRQAEEAERQRQFEEEAIRLAEEQRTAEEERLRQAIEEAKQREEVEKRKREEEERQRLEREEAEKKAKEEAEKQRIEVAERLKREEKEREERRKRVEAIMSRTRRSGTTSATPNSTPTKENLGTHIQKTSTDTPNNLIAPNNSTNTMISLDEEKNANSTISSTATNNSESNSTSSLSSITTTTPTTSNDSLLPGTIITTTTTATAFSNVQSNKSHNILQNSQSMYEQSVVNKENSLINCFSNLIINENVKNIQQQQQQQLQNQFMIELQKNHEPVSNGNGNHIDIINQNECDLIKTVPTANQLVDITIDSHDNINFKNNNNLLSTTTSTTNTALVTADSHENKDVSLL